MTIQPPSRSSDPDDEAPHRQTIAKIAWKIVPLCAVGFLLSYVDRTNISMAALTMNADLGLSPTAFGWAVSLFFVSYILCEVPSNLALRRYGARIWLARIMITWGIISGAMAFVNGPVSLYVMRVLLGAAEAGYTVGVVYYFTLWFPRAYRTRMLGYFFVATPLALVVSTPVSGYLLGMDGLFGFRGWQWLFLLEGIPSAILGVLFLALLPSTPDEAGWLDPAEKAWLARTLTREQESSHHLADFREALSHGNVWLLSFCYLFLLTGILGLGYWLPQMIKTFGVDNKTVGLLATVPSVAAVVGILVWSRVAQGSAHPERHVAAGSFIGFLSLALAAYGTSPQMSYAAVILSYVGLWSAFGVFWPVVTRVLAGPGSAAAIAFISAFGTLSGVFGPSLIGWLLEVTGDHKIGILVMSSAAVAAAVISPFFGDSRQRGGVQAGPVAAIRPHYD